MTNRLRPVAMLGAIPILGLLAPTIGWSPMLHAPLPWLLAALATAAIMTQPAYVPSDSTSTDGGTARNIAIASALYGPLVMSEARFRVGPAALDFGVAAIVGLVVLISGLLLRAWSVRTLGRFFTLHVKVAEQQPVIRSGPYRWVRHPSYLGGLMIYLGLATSLSAWVSLALGCVLFPRLFHRRIRLEEAALLETLGPAYREYCATTPALLPFGSRTR